MHTNNTKTKFGLNLFQLNKRLHLKQLHYSYKLINLPSVKYYIRAVIAQSI
jgi:hypothetical protein